MPRVHSSVKQKNKKFKGKSKGEHKVAKISKTKTKQISKISSKRDKASKNQLIKDKKNKKVNEIEKLTSINEYLDVETKSIIRERMKQQSQIKIVLLLPCNEDANSDQIAKAIFNCLPAESFTVKTDLNACRSFSSFQVFPIVNKTFMKNKVFFISPKKDLHQLIDLAKCADIICPILSCKSTNTKGMSLDPHAEGKAFDQNGYTILNLLRSLGLPNIIGLIQHLELHEQKHQPKITKLFKRFFASELGEEEKVITLENQSDITQLLRAIDSANIKHQPWKNERGYMIVDNVVSNQNKTVTFEGFLKGNCVHANQLIHITGFDDYEIEKIEIKKVGSAEHRFAKSQMDVEEKRELTQHSTISDEMCPFSKPKANDDDILTAFQGLKFQQQNKVEIEEENNEDFIDQGSQISSDNEYIDEQQYFGNKQDQKAKRVQMQMRKADQLEFQDQIQYASDQILREKFKDYQGLKNFKTSEWNHLQNLPEEYDRIFSFKHYQKTLSNVLKENLAKGYAYKGFYISVTLKGFPVEKLEQHCQKFPLIGTFLLKHERKMTVLHAKVRRNPFYPNSEAQIKSNQLFYISMGFRRFSIKPIFSRCINGTQKTKYTAQIKQDFDSYFYCSFYYYNYFPPAPFSIYKINPLNETQIEPMPIMHGELVKCDPMHIILERIMLTGYPYKINKRRSTVRFMFFNPKDVKFFKPIEVRTKLGLRGKIQESLGTHGLMKCMFSDKIKHNDTVCMSLYRRVFPEPNF